MSIFFISTFAANASPVSVEQLKLADDAFAMRGEPVKSEVAYKLYKEYFAANPENFETGWRFAMASYFVGNRVIKENDKKARIFSEGRDAGLAAIKLNPNCAACHFWTAINMALYGDAVGAVKMLSSVSKIEEHLNESIKLDPKYANAGAYRLLGIIKQKLPGILGGSNKKAREYFEKAIETCKDEPLNYLMLATLYRENLGEPQKALETAKEGLKLDPPSVDRLESLEAYNELKQMVPTLQAKL